MCLAPRRSKARITATQQQWPDMTPKSPEIPRLFKADTATVSFDAAKAGKFEPLFWKDAHLCRVAHPKPS